ncbi:flagellar protein FliS [Novipirellula aureliae]|uniref:Flagellar protein FliS n=1 Tax=Novipirellula aureliae TaxID=2527966 RepID=A0A5C6DY87_9BACT|nr:flagellar export chaperone FliS [Novipirellula aureliae]TWU41578.1 flagellar protein FliS [Novipirellula aureliae]
MSYAQSKPASNFRPSGYQTGRGSADEYLDSMVRSASPARLRLIVLERAVETATTLSATWREDTSRKGPNEWSLKLLDLISELLSGITSDEGVCGKVADLYVFLSKHLIIAERTGDADAIDEIRLVLEVEAETWRMVCANELGASDSRQPITSGGLNLEG